MRGTVAITDYGWYRTLKALPALEEVNFWKPSTYRSFRAPEFSPFFFKLRAPHNAICGYAFFARYSVLPDWLAWETFAEGNGTATFRELRDRILAIRDRIRFRGETGTPEIGCILLVQPTFFDEADWVRPPADWPVRTQSYIGYDLAVGEGARVYADCLARGTGPRPLSQRRTREQVAAPAAPRYGAAGLVAPRLGQGTFRIAVTDAYGRACAVTEEHSLPALEAAHIRSYTEDGPHLVGNGLLLRADFHNLFDRGYLTVTADHRLEVSNRLRAEFENGRSYYPYHGKPIRLPARPADHPAAEFLEWHRTSRYLG
jgi:putative restriction endonuclease